MNLQPFVGQIRGCFEMDRNLPGKCLLILAMKFAVSSLRNYIPENFSHQFARRLVEDVPLGNRIEIQQLPLRVQGNVGIGDAVQYLPQPQFTFQ